MDDRSAILEYLLEFPKASSRAVARLYRSFGPDWRTVLAAVLIVFAFPPWDFSFLIWIAAIPWLAALERAPTWRRGFREGVWLSLLMTIGGYSWVAHSLQQFGNIHGSLAALGLVFFGLIGQPQFHAYGAIRRWAKSSLEHALPERLRPWVIPAALAMIYTALDWIAPKIFHDTFGHSQYNATDVRQLSEIGGARMITFVIWWFAEAAWGSDGLHLFRPARPRLTPKNSAFAAVAVCVLAAIGWGHFKYIEIRDWTQNRSRTVRMSAIQANIGDFEKLASESGVSDAAYGVIRKYITLSSSALNEERPPDLIVWPETAYPSTFRTPMSGSERTRDEMLESFVRYRRAPLLFGGYDHLNGKDFNALFFLEPPSPEPLDPKADAPPDEPNRFDTYRKNVLLPFGEYVPFVENWEWVREAFPQIGFFGRGIGPSVHTVRLRGGRTVKIAPIICYEALLPWYLAESAAKGSEVILNVTNDSWFGPFGEPQLHLSLAAFRSTETRRSQFRATNTGISALVLPDGTITQASEIGAQTVLTADVPILLPSPPETLIIRWGDWFGPFSAGVCLLGLGIPVALSRRRRTSANAV